MTGHEIGLLPDRAIVESSHQHPPLEVRDLVVAAPDARGENLLDRLSFSVGSGEILGVAGVEGNGQREVVETVTGLREPDSGEILLAGEDVTATDATMRRRRGLSVIPVDRHGLGLVLDMSLAENLMLSDIPAGRYDSRGLLQWKLIRGNAKQLLEEYDVRPPDPSLKAASLSGGNQQKVVLARELSRDPSVLVADNPTWGLDVGAIGYVHRRLIEMRDLGGAILLLTLDLDELFTLADRVLVLYRGRKMLERAASDIGEDDLALAMAGRAAQ
jgi:simple sugar transport system ATP-binding protein